MKKILSLIVLLVLFVGCNNEPLADIDQPKLPEPEVNNEYAIPVEYAVSELEAFLEQTSERAATKSATKTIKKVETVSSVSLATRSGNAEISPSVYIVSFAEDGYAVLGADARAPGILAISDAGTLQADHFAYKELESSSNNALTKSGQIIDSGGVGSEGVVSAITEEEFPYLLASFINAYTQETIAEAEQNQQVDTRLTWTWNGKVWTFLELIDQQVKTIWHQNPPFNQNVTVGGKYMVAGCVAVAMAQICAYNQFPKTEGSHTFPYQRIRNVQSFYNNGRWSEGVNDQQYASYLVAVCGLKAKTNYGVNSSSATDANAADALSSMGYKNISIRRRSNTDIDGDVRGALRRNCPTYYSGHKSAGLLSSGHAWVVDGLWRLQSGNEFMNLLHCNFGWGGLHNGWYREGVFNTSRSMVSYSGYGDYYSPENGGTNYSTRHQAITYSKP